MVQANKNVWPHQQLRHKHFPTTSNPAYGAVDKISPPPLNVKAWQWVLMTNYQFVYSWISTAMALYILPKQAESLNEHNPSIWLGAYLAVCGSTQLICPIAGKLSDRFRSPWGRRRPFIIVGTALCVGGIGLLMAASSMQFRWLFLFALFPSQLGMNVVYAAQCGLVADFEERHEQSEDSGSAKGIISGIIGAHSFLGSLAAVGMLAAKSDVDMPGNYALFMILLSVGCMVVCVVSNEASSNVGVPMPQLSRHDIQKSFVLDRTVDPDFFWVCIGRLCYYVGTSCTAYMLWYVRDMLGVHDNATAMVRLAILIASAQTVGAAVSLPFGYLSNRVGRKPVIYGACAAMSVSWVLYIIAPVAQKGGSWNVALTAAIAYGLGSGVYMSVDYALALDCMPSDKSKGEAFGIWGVSGFCGALIGPSFVGMILALCQNDELLHHSEHAPPGYTYTGYVINMLFLGIAMNALAALATMQIRFVKTPALATLKL